MANKHLWLVKFVSLTVSIRAHPGMAVNFCISFSSCTRFCVWNNALQMRCSHGAIKAMLSLNRVEWGWFGHEQANQRKSKTSRNLGQTHSFSHVRFASPCFIGNLCLEREMKQSSLNTSYSPQSSYNVSCSWWNCHVWCSFGPPKLAKLMQA